MTEEKYKEVFNLIRKEQIENAKPTFSETYDPYEANIARDYFEIGALWADLHPRGFINEEKYVNGILERKDITNKEFIEMLKQFPEDALVSIECCNPRAMFYDEQYNLIRID